jgi:hypothetical protein
VHVHRLITPSKPPYDALNSMPSDWKTVRVLLCMCTRNLSDVCVRAQVFVVAKTRLPASEQPTWLCVIARRIVALAVDTRRY